PRYAVMRRAALAVHVLDRDLADARAQPAGQRGDEPVQLAVERYLFEDVTAIRFEGCAEVMDVYAAQLRHQPIRYAGREPPHHKIVNALLPPATDYVITLGHFFQK